MHIIRWYMRYEHMLLYIFIFSTLNNWVTAQQIPGISFLGSQAILESTATIMARDSGAPTQPVCAHPLIKRPLKKGVLPPDFPSQDESSHVDDSLAITRSPQTLSSINFTAASLATTGFFPPDSDGAVGPSQFFTVVNGRVKTFSKYTGVADGVLDTSLDNFFASVRNGSTTTDPKVRFDRFSDHWFIVCINEATGPNRVLLAVSNSREINPSTIWRLFFFDQSAVLPTGDANLFFDFPTLGIDVNALYIGGNEFDNLGNFVNCTGFVIQKTSMFGLGPLVATAFRNLIVAGSGPFTPQGVDNFDAGATQGFFLGINSTVNLALRIISNPGSTTPTISGNIFIPIATTAAPLNVPSLGGANPLDGIDERLSSVHIRNNQMWAVHNIGVDNTGVSTGAITRDGCRWYQFDVSAPLTPTTVQFGTLFDSTVANPRFYWIPSIMSTGQGHMAIGCSAAGATQFANAATVGRLSTDSLGTLETPVLYTSSSTSYNPPGGIQGGIQRWGDYSYTSLDPLDNMTLWTIQEWCNATDSYGCQVVQLIAPPPATIISAIPSSVARGLASVSVQINGASVSGSGFYDPGSAFEKRLTAQVSGGVIVNSVTFINATTVILNLNTIYASPGTQFVRIENPDGQQSVAAVLTIT